jgi:cyclopropane fatty-acyl-phospholipid synthase-like methyltransferase
VACEWISYNHLAWTEDWLVDPSEFEEEAAIYVGLLQRGAVEARRTLLHLGSGSGAFDAVFAQHFEVTGVDLSVGMLARARAAALADLSLHGPSQRRKL